MRKLKNLTLVLTMIMFVGCSNNEATTKFTVPVFSEEQEINYVKYNDINSFDKGKKLDESWQEEANSLSKSVCDYLNKEYVANWKTEKMEVFQTDITDKLEDTGISYGAMYYKGDILIDKYFQDSDNDIQKKYVLVHEIVHGLFDINQKVYQKFYLSNKTGDCGFYLEEAIVDMLAKEYMLENAEAKKEDLLSGYKYIRMYAEVLKLALPNYMDYFFAGDLEGLHQAFNNHAEKHLECKGDAFEKWMSLLDETFMAYSSQNNEVVDGCISIMGSFLVVITPKEKADEFEELIGQTMEEPQKYFSMKKLKNYMY